MKRKTVLQLCTVAVCLIALGGCSGSGVRTHMGVGVGLGFYHGGYGSWGSGYYRGYDHGAADAIDTIDAMDSMGMPDMDMGPAMDFDF